MLYFLAQSFRAQLIKELPKNRGNLSGESFRLAERAKELLVQLAELNPEVALMLVSSEENGALPNWFVMDAARTLPILAGRRNGK